MATSDRPNRQFVRLLGLLREFRDTTQDTAVRQSATVIVDYLTNRIEHADQTNPLNRHDIEVIRRALREHIDMPWIDPAVLIRTAREELKIRDAVTPF